MAADTPQLTAILIDDSAEHLELLDMALTEPETRRAIGLDGPVLTFTDPAEARKHLPEDGEAIIFCDYRMPGATGLEWVPDFVAPDVGPVFIMTSQGSEQIASEAFKAGATDYLVKSAAMEDSEYLSHAVNDGLKRFRLERENRRLTEHIREANSDLSEKNARLVALTDNAHRFVDNVAHEFRTPLTVVKEFASIMNDGLGGDVTDEQRDFLLHIIAAARDLSQMVDDFLDSSKLRTRTLRVDRRRHTVNEIIESVRMMIDMRAEHRRITVNVDVAPDLPDVFCDLEKAGRTIVNLAVNAIKFSPEDSVIDLWAMLGEDGDVRIGVTDRGPGLNEEDIAVIGERFRQVGDPHRTSAKGFGLGLNIAKELVWLNFGEMHIESAVGEGSTFSFTLIPAAHQRVIDRYVHLMESQQQTAKLSGLRAIATGDDPNNETLCAFLSSVCHPMDLVFPAEDGCAALVLGAAGNTENWIRRITEAHEKVCRQGGAHKTGPFELATLGSWAFPEATQCAAAIAADTIQGVKRCA